MTKKADKLVETRKKIDGKLAELGYRSPDVLIGQLLEARGKIDSKLAELGQAPRIQDQLTALSAKIDAIANRTINVTIPERQVIVNNTPSESDLEVHGPGGKMSVRRIRRVV